MAMASVQTPTMTQPPHHQHPMVMAAMPPQPQPQPQTTTPQSLQNSMVVLSDRSAKPTTRSTRASKPLLAMSPQIPATHPAINLTLLRHKLILTCRAYVQRGLLDEAVADGIWASAERWITPASQLACRQGKSKRYYVLHTQGWTLEAVGSSWEARVIARCQPIDAGNGVVLFVKEMPQWNAFMRGYKKQAKRGAGQLLKGRQADTERRWKAQWKAQCGLVSKGGKREINAGPMWCLVKGAVGKIVRGDA